jgi:hypothetical protein
MAVYTPILGIATVTYLVEGSITYIDPNNVTGVPPAGGDGDEAHRAGGNSMTEYEM